MKAKDRQEDIKKKHAEEEAKRKAEEEKRKKEDEEAKLPEEEKLRIATKKQAEAKKAEGNDFYKKKDFPNALRLYGEALELDPNEILYMTNQAAVYYEMKEYDKCIEVCD